MLVGTAWVDVTPSEPLELVGQMHTRTGNYTHDPLTVNAMVFRTPEATVALVSVDICVLVDDFLREAKVRVAEQTGIRADHVLIAATHTHVAPAAADNLLARPDPRWVAGLRDAIARAVATSLADLEEVELHAGEGFAKEFGWNRRGLHADGRADMYHGSWNADFAGIEGPRDGAVPVIVARRANGAVKAVVTGFASHCNCVEGESFYSADFPGVMRRFLRRNLVGGDGLGVVYLTGAAGDTAPSIMENNPRNIQPWRGEAGLERTGTYLGSEALQVIHESMAPKVPAMRDPVLRLVSRSLRIPVREWGDFDPSKLAWEGPRVHFMQVKERWPSIAAKGPVAVNVHVLRIGDAAICTNPGELYCQFGLDIKKDSPAKVTIVSELTDGYVNYIPTRKAIAGGGYSAWPGSALLAPEAGETIVANTREMLREVF